MILDGDILSGAHRNSHLPIVPVILENRSYMNLKLWQPYIYKHSIVLILDAFLVWVSMLEGKSITYTSALFCHWGPRFRL